MGEMQHATPAQRLRPHGHDADGWFDALYPHLHRVACVAAPADVDPDDLVRDALVNYLQLDDPDTVRSAKAFLTTSMSQLTVPESGAMAQQLADGTPVWVVRHADGSVSVVDAVSTHRPLGAGTLVGWCESSPGFLDPMYGSQYDEHGRKQAGPAPAGSTSIR